MFSRNVIFLQICPKVVPKGAQKSPLGAILETFGVPVPAFWRALGHLWHTWGPTVDLVGFRGAGHTPEACRRQGHGTCGDMVKQHLGLPGEGFT